MTVTVISVNCINLITSKPGHNSNLSYVKYVLLIMYIMLQVCIRQGNLHKVGNAYH